MHPRLAARQLLALRPATRRAAIVRTDVGPSFGEIGRAYAGTTPFSAMLSWLTPVAMEPRVTIAVPSVHPATAFAGVKTALSFASSLAESLGLGLRVVTFDRGGAPTTSLDPSFGLSEPVDVIGLGDGVVGDVGANDLWIATHWSTAHAIDVACRDGMLDVSRVVYLVQDYEPGFVAWSSEYAAIRATYRAGFLTVVNSTPLRDYLEAQEAIRIDDRFVIGPDLEFERLERLRASGAPAGPVGIFFYARPGKPRNLYSIGAAALRRTAALLGPDAKRCVLHTAGDEHVPIAPGLFADERSHGSMGWDAYFDLLGDCHVGLSLMYSPHPSHPPLDLALAGRAVVTNRFANYRDGLHPLVTAAEPDPDALAIALVERIREVLSGPHSVVGAAAPLAPLGGPLGDVVARVAAELAHR